MNTMTTHRNWSWIAAVIAIGLVTSSAVANTVRLKRGAVVAPDRALVLRDIAELDGAYAADLGGTLIAAEAGELLDAAGSGSVSLNRVRASLERDGAILSRLTLSGAECAIRTGRTPQIETDDDEQPVEQSAWRTLSDWQDQSDETVEIAIVRRLAQGLNVTPDRLRLKFRSGREEVLGLTTGSRRTVVQPLSSLDSAVVLFRVERYLPSGSLERSEAVSAEVQILRSVLKLREQVSRREAIPGGILEASEQWMTASVDAVSAIEAHEMVGKIAQSRLQAGTILLRTHTEKPIAVKRNSLVQVIYHVEGFVLKTQGRTRGEGRVGEIIEVRIEDTKKSILARVDAPGREILVE